MDQEIVFVNPGEKLRSLLSSMFNYEHTSGDSILSKIDDVMAANGELALLTYSSLINYVTRRLITASEYIKRKYSKDEYPSGYYVEKIREHLKDNTRIPAEQCEEVLAILLECLAARSRKVQSKVKQRMRQTAQNDGLKCYICGCDMNFTSSDEYLAAVIEHVWPNAMGGDRHTMNLRVSCKKCSDNKRSYIDSSDFHFEEMCITSEEKDDDFDNKLSRQFKIAVWTKSQYSCILCGKPASQGSLGFARRNPNDNWHFLNMDAYCAEHLAQISAINNMPDT